MPEPPSARARVACLHCELEPAPPGPPDPAASPAETVANCALKRLLLGLRSEMNAEHRRDGVAIESNAVTCPFASEKTWRRCSQYVGDEG